jgi:hypothetical protein
MRKTYQPRRLSQELSIQCVGDETLIYDERRHVAFCLNQVSSAVWTHCDGAQSVAQIAAALRSELAQPVTEEIVDLALAQMEENGLLEPDTDSPSEAGLAAHGPISRRSLMATLGAGAMMMLPAPAIAAVVAPKAADTGSVTSYHVPDQVDSFLPGLGRFRRTPRQSSEGQ